MKECGIYWCVKNIVAWTVAPERNNIMYGVKSIDYWPKAVIYEMTRERYTFFRQHLFSDFDLLFMNDATD